jgi:UDP-N-acetyl-D-galactosamine dehydrogenase
MRGRKVGERIAIIGLGYVGLPVAVSFAENLGAATGFDINRKRVDELLWGVDKTGEIDPERLRLSALKITADVRDLAGATFFVVTVPTPIDDDHQPDLAALRKACEMIGSVLSPDTVVVFESTVYPGVTEEICGPILSRVSGLTQGVDFKLGYSPERINPGDKEHTFDQIVKVISGEDEKTTDRIADVYGAVVTAGLHRATSIRVAEAAKVIENTQRDLNIALMNELALIFDRLGLRTQDVLDAAGTKWNFLRFKPGLVGGHCIGVDPYYLTAKAEMVGYHPQVILAGRRINNSMGAFIAQRLVKLLIQGNHPVRGAKVGILGLTFKENVPDFRNSKVFDVFRELQQFGIEPLIHDPLADAEEVHHEYGLDINALIEFKELHALILAVPHSDYMESEGVELFARLNSTGVLIDVKSVLCPQDVPEGLLYWSL